jgi:hypothetical protein
MKKLKIYALLLLAAAVVMSCDEDLNLEPEQDLSTNAAFEDENTTRASLAGVYSRMQDLSVWGSQPQIINEYMADNVRFVGSFPTLQDINNYITLADNLTIREIWRDHYRVVLAANAVIEFAPGVDVPGFSDDEKAQIVAEATALRALAYFNLVNLFAQPYTLDNGASLGVPLVLSPNILLGDATFPSRATVAEVYTQIENDLNAIIDELPSGAGNPGFVTKGAVHAFLSRIHLYKGEWDDAATQASNALGEGHEIASDYNFYNTSNLENIFVISNSAIDNGRTGAGGWASYYQPGSLGGRGDAPFSDDLLAAYEDGDLRFENLHLEGNDAAGIAAVFTTKFPDAINNSDDSPVFRATEMYLNRAEALVASKNEVDPEAISLINELRVRAGLSEYTAGDFAGPDELLDAIRVERRKELAFEGHRRPDLLRIGEPLRADQPEITAPGADKVILPIPQQEIDVNPNLDQNTGY